MSVDQNKISSAVIEPLLLYKLGTPMFDNEPEWSITLSQIDFPWREIWFGDFTPNECYAKYKELITDEFDFNRYIWGETQTTYKKLVWGYQRGNKQYRVTLSKV